MKKLVLLMSVVALTLIPILQSCSNEDFTDSCNISMSSKTNRLTAEEAQQNALEFVNNLHSSTRSNSKALKVSAVKAISGDKSITRAVGDSLDLDTLFYVVEFEDNNGFVLASSDKRETPVFAYVEEGTCETEDSSDTNAGYEAFYAALQDLEIKNRTLYHDDPKIDEIYDGLRPSGPEGGPVYDNVPDAFEIMYPLLKTKWDQKLYNFYCPNDYTGCVPTAISQICSYLKKPNHLSWVDNGVNRECDIDWNMINEDCALFGGTPVNTETREQISCLMRYWGIQFGAEYKSGETTVDSEEAISKFQQLGFNATPLCDYNAKDVISDLKKGGRIVFMRGNGRYYHEWFFFRKYVDGHAWVVDGYIHSVKNMRQADYLHCNWGWGGNKNGYFLSDVLNAEEDPVYDDDGALTRSNNYRYRLKTSTISK